MKRADMLKQLRIDLPRLKKGEEYCCLSTMEDVYKDRYTVYITKMGEGKK